MKTTLVSLLFAGTLLVSCGKTEQDKPATDTTSQSTEQKPQVQTAEARGKIVEIAQDKKSVTLDHGKIGDLMEAMVMPFDVKDPAILNDLKVGDSVLFSVEYSEDSGFLLTSAKKL